MTAKIIMSPTAKQDLTKIGDYIAFQLHNKSAARNTIRRIEKAVMALRHFPKMGTLLSFDSTNSKYRYLVCGNYMVFYHLPENNIYIDRILYGRRDYLAILFGNEFNEESDI